MDQIQEATSAELKARYQELIEQIVISQNTILIKLSSEQLFRNRQGEKWLGQSIEIIRLIDFKRRGQELKLAVGEAKEPTSNPDPDSSCLWPNTFAES